MTTAHPACLEFIDFIVQGTTPQQIIAFHPSARAQARLDDLLTKEREKALSPDEQVELTHFFELKHNFRMAKARSEQILVRAS